MLNEIEKLFLAPGIVSLLVTLAATKWVISLAWRFNLIDDPSKSAHPKIIHTKPVPRAGGAAIFIGILLSVLIFLPLDKHMLGILAGATLITITGILDDKFNLSPYFRLGIQFLAAALPIAAGIGIAFVTNPLTGGIINLNNPQITFNFLGNQTSIWLLADLLALFWIVSLMNFLNMGAKGVDGQLTGVVAIAALAIAILSLNFSADITEWPVIILASILFGTHIGFLPWHIYPQKIMPGFSGSNLAGYMLAVLSILTTTKLGLLALVLAVPLIDTSYTILRRLIQKKSPVWGDRGHLHHRLLDTGLTKSQVAYFYWGISALLGLVALTLNSLAKLYTIVAVLLLLGSFILWLAQHNKSIKSKAQ